MTTPDVPLRLELTIEVPGPPEQVWDALATVHGISSWMMPTDGEEGLGGTLVFHMGEGEGESSQAEITVWERPTRVAYIEPDWATLMGRTRMPRSPRWPLSSWSKPRPVAPASCGS